MFLSKFLDIKDKRQNQICFGPENNQFIEEKESITFMPPNVQHAVTKKDIDDQARSLELLSLNLERPSLFRLFV